MNRNLILVSAALFLWGLGESMFLYLQPLYLQELGADPIRIGVILGGYGAFMALAHIPAGYLADRIGPRPLLWFAWIQGTVAAWVMALSPNLSGFVAGLFLYGLTTFVSAPLNSYLTATRGRLSVGQTLLLISSTYNLGQIFGPLIGGWIGQDYGLRTIFFIAAGIFIASTIIILNIRLQPRRIVSPAGNQSLSFARQRSYLSYLALIFIVVASAYLAQPLSQNYLHNEMSLSIQTIGRLTSLIGVGVVIFSLILSRINTRLGFLLSQAAVACFALLLWQGSSLPWFALGYFMLGGYRPTRSLATAQASFIVPAEKLGLAYGILETVCAAAVMSASLAAGLIYTRNPVWIYPAGITLIAISILVSYKLAPSPKAEPASLTIPAA